LAQQQAALLRAGRPGEIDISHVARANECDGSSERHALFAHMGVPGRPLRHVMARNHQGRAVLERESEPETETF
jgi:hypothetical protein